MDYDFTGMTPEQIEARCYAMLGIRKKTPEELAEMYAEEQARKQREQKWLEREYNDGEDWVFRRQCPVCGTVFYATNPHQIYDDYYKCSRYIHRETAKFKRRLKRATVVCQQCGERFKPDRAGAKYCCNACRQKAYRERKQLGQNDRFD